jgi:hypothetical protein
MVQVHGGTLKGLAGFDYVIHLSKLDHRWSAASRAVTADIQREGRIRQPVYSTSLACVRDLGSAELLKTMLAICTVTFNALARTSKRFYRTSRAASGSYFRRRSLEYYRSGPHPLRKKKERP